MTESAERQAPAADQELRREAEMSERALGRAVAAGLPLIAIVVALALGVAVGIGPALLVLAGGAILGTISLLWASIRTLSGDAPLAESLSTLGSSALSGGASERKRAALRALKDLELEHSIGKIDDADYAEMVARYRGEAKAIMKELDIEIEPLRGRAEELARQYLTEQGLAEASPAPTEAPEGEGVGDDGSDEDDANAPGAPNAEASVSRLECSSCSASNEPDATFCKKCGTPLRRRCAACETVNEPDATFCKKCGGKLGAMPKERADVRA